MAKRTPPPTYEAIAGDDAKVKQAWLLFFNSTYLGDTGTDWTPTFSNLTITGTPTITGRYYKLSDALTFFRVKIVPSTDTSAVAGTTYISNMPVRATADGFCLAVSGLLGTNAGMWDSATNRVYVPTWTTVTVPLTILGFAEAK